VVCGLLGADWVGCDTAVADVEVVVLAVAALCVLADVGAPLVPAVDDVVEGGGAGVPSGGGNVEVPGPVTSAPLL
jgi:hypothetical protein